MVTPYLFLVLVLPLVYWVELATVAMVVLPRASSHNVSIGKTPLHLALTRLVYSFSEAMLLSFDLPASFLLEEPPSPFCSILQHYFQLRLAWGFSSFWVLLPLGVGMRAHLLLFHLFVWTCF